MRGSVSLACPGLPNERSIAHQNVQRHLIPMQLSVQRRMRLGRTRLPPDALSSAVSPRERRIQCMISMISG